MMAGFQIDLAKPIELAELHDCRLRKVIPRAGDGGKLVKQLDHALGLLLGDGPDPWRMSAVNSGHFVTG